MITYSSNNPSLLDSEKVIEIVKIGSILNIT